MGLGPGIRRLLRLPDSRVSIEREVNDEVAFHIETRVDALVGDGLAPHEARRQALAEFGDVRDARRVLARIDRRGAGRRRWQSRWDSLRHNVTLAVRGMRRAPGFTLAVVATLSVGIGVTASMFSVVDRLLLRPAPWIVDANSLRQMYYRVTYPVLGTYTGDSRGYFDYTDLLQQSRQISGAAAYFPASLTWGTGDGVQRINSQLTTASFFPLLGVHPQLGRFYGPDEDAVGNAAHVVVVADGFWRRQLGGDPSVLGSVVDIDGSPYTIIGVAPRGFRGVGIEPVEAFVPMSALAPKLIAPDWATVHGWQWLRILVRLTPRSTDASFAAEATTIFRRSHASDEGDRAATAVPASVIPGRAPDGGRETPVAVLLMTVSILVLVIATANVANLLVTRALRRRQEIAVRIALGVSRARLVSQLLTESVVLAVIAGGCAVAVAFVGGALLRHLLMPSFAPDDPVVDLRVFLLAAVAALGCGIAGGLAPVMVVQRRGFADVARTGTREGSYRRSRLRSVLVIAQAALSLTLVAGAALYAASLRKVLTKDLGFDARHVFLVAFDLPSSVDSTRRMAVPTLARERLAALPGVVNAAVAVDVPFMSSYGTKLRVEGYDSLPRLKSGGPYINSVGEEYFATMGMRVKRGRDFRSTDVTGSPPVAVVNATMERFYFKGQPALGKCLYLGDSLPPCISIVGVINDAHRESVHDVENAMYYVLDRQRAWDTPADRVVMVRTAGDPKSLFPAVRAALTELGLTSQQFYAQSLQDLIEPQLRPWRLGASLLVTFGVIALIVAAVGLYSVVAYDAAQRMQEVGVRLALGASVRSIVTLILSDGLRNALIGAGVGLVGALVAGAFIRDQLFEVSPREPSLLAAAVVLLLLTSSLACLIPARRITRIDPCTALRAE